MNLLQPSSPLIAPSVTQSRKLGVVLDSSLFPAPLCLTPSSCPQPPHPNSTQPRQSHGPGLPRPCLQPQECNSPTSRLHCVKQGPSADRKLLLVTSNGCMHPNPHPSVQSHQVTLARALLTSIRTSVPLTIPEESSLEASELSQPEGHAFLNVCPYHIPEPCACLSVSFNKTLSPLRGEVVSDPTESPSHGGI